MQWYVGHRTVRKEGERAGNGECACTANLAGSPYPYNGSLGP
jgi:hypothetical protein